MNANIAFIYIRNDFDINNRMFAKELRTIK